MPSWQGNVCTRKNSSDWAGVYCKNGCVFEIQLSATVGGTPMPAYSSPKAAYEVTKPSLRHAIAYEMLFRHRSKMF